MSANITLPSKQTSVFLGAGLTILAFALFGINETFIVSAQILYGYWAIMSFIGVCILDENKMYKFLNKYICFNAKEDGFVSKALTWIFILTGAVLAIVTISLAFKGFPLTWGTFFIYLYTIAIIIVFIRTNNSD